MPEVDLTRARTRPNPYAKRIARESLVLPGGRGRPARAAKAESAVPKSIRLPEQVWQRIARRAEKEGMTLHAALQAAVLEWLNRAA